MARAAAAAAGSTRAGFALALIVALGCVSGDPVEAPVAGERTATAAAAPAPTPDPVPPAPDPTEPGPEREASPTPSRARPSTPERALAEPSAGAPAVAPARAPDGPAARGTGEKKSARCTYYAAPVQADGGEIPTGGAWGSSASRSHSFAEPGTVAGFLASARPGDMLCLRSGTYRGAASMLAAPRGLGGARGQPIHVVALDEGTVAFDGERGHVTVAITGSHWRLRGFDAYDSKAAIIGVDGRTHGARDIQIQRVVAWRNPYETYPNIMNVDISFAEDLLLEDVGCFGNARKCVQVHRSARVTTRRVWARFDGRYPHTLHNEFAFTAMYRSFDSLAENVLATTGGDDQTDYTPDSYRGQEIWLIGTDRGPEADDAARFAPGRDRFDVHLRTLGSIAYARSGGRFIAKGVLMTRAGMKHSEIRDVAVSVPANSDRVILLNDCVDGEFPCRWRGVPGEHNRASKLTLAGGTPGAKTRWKINDWDPKDVVRRDMQEPVDIFTPGNGGASICHRTVDGETTREPLWPWPMNDRILAATRRSQWGEADVTADIEALFGEIPAMCRWDR